MSKKLFHKIIRQPFKRKEGSVDSPHFGKKFAAKAKKGIDKGVRNMGNEATETKEMAHSFFKLLEHKLNMNERTVPPTEEEVKIAIEQLKDIGRLSVFTTAVIIPGGAVSLMGLEMLARKFGIKFTFIPSSFRKNAEWKQPAGRKPGPIKSRINRRKNDISDIKPIED
jgi:hypothetical protein